MKNPFGERPSLSKINLIRREKEPIRERPVLPLENLQAKDVVDALEVPGFLRLQVVATLERDPFYALKTDTHNQDCVLADSKSKLLGVFDGIGGVPFSSRSSRFAAQAIPKHFEAALSRARSVNDLVVLGSLTKLLRRRPEGMGWFSPTEKERALKQTEKLAEQLHERDPELLRKAHALVTAINFANEDIENLSKNPDESRRPGLTTACVGFVHTTPDARRYAVVTNVGDSGAFIRRANGNLEPLTQEDSMIRHLIQAGHLSLPGLYAMKSEPLKKFPIAVGVENGKTIYESKNYYLLSVETTGYLGSDHTTPSLAMTELFPGDELIFCTDGVIDKFERVITTVPPESEMEENQTDFTTFTRAASSGATFRERINELRQDAALRTAYKQSDDIAIVAARVPTSPPLPNSAKAKRSQKK